MPLEIEASGKSAIWPFRIMKPAQMIATRKVSGNPAKILFLVINVVIMLI